MRAVGWVEPRLVAASHRSVTAVTGSGQAPEDRRSVTAVTDGGQAHRARLGDQRASRRRAAIRRILPTCNVLHQ